MKKTIIIVGTIALILLSISFFFRKYSKSFSPESEATYDDGAVKIHITYCSPFKKGRLVFGELVPFGKIWRTGANEATIFETNVDLKFGGQTLKAGTYSLWTIPGEQSWKIIFNSEYGQWGINFNGEANIDEKDDVLKVDVQPLLQDKVFEQFKIEIKKAGEGMEMILEWDKTLVPVPFSK